MAFDCTVITTVLNAESHILSCIRSVVAQKWVHVFHIIIDGGSVDRTLLLVNECEEFDGLLINRPGASIYQALNLGISKAQGSFFGILNADDRYCHQSVLADVKRYLTESSRPEIIWGGTLISSGNRPLRIIFPDLESVRRKSWIPPHPSMFVRNNKKNRLYRYSEEFKYGSDLQYMLDIIDDCEIFEVQDIFVKMKTGGISNSIGLKKIIHLKECMMIFFRKVGVKSILFFLSRLLYNVNK